MRVREENAWFYAIGEDWGLPVDEEVLMVCGGTL